MQMLNLQLFVSLNVRRILTSFGLIALGPLEVLSTVHLSPCMRREKRTVGRSNEIQPLSAGPAAPMNSAGKGLISVVLAVCTADGESPPQARNDLVHGEWESPSVHASTNER